MSRLYGFAFSEAALKFLQSRVDAKQRGQIKRKIEALSQDPYPVGCKKLQGIASNEEPIYRIRSGDYRVLYVVRESPPVVIVLAINHRKDVYR